MAGLRGLITQLGIQPCSVFQLWMNLVVVIRLTTMPAWVEDVMPMFKVGDHAPHVASRDAAVLKAEVS